MSYLGWILRNNFIKINERGMQRQAVGTACLAVINMIVSQLMQIEDFRLLNQGVNIDRKISVPYCCDLLSFAMGRMPSSAAWVTVMGNVNTLAVAVLADAACIILAEGSSLDEAALNKAKEQSITVYKTKLPIFEAALSIYKEINV
jgi:hypothetical protein